MNLSLNPAHQGETQAEEGAEQAAETQKVLEPRYEAGLRPQGNPKGRQVLTGLVATNPGWGSLSSWLGEACPWVKS